jgi:hypothetical protein
MGVACIKMIGTCREARRKPAKPLISTEKKTRTLNPAVSVSLALVMSFIPLLPTNWGSSNPIFLNSSRFSPTPAWRYEGKKTSTLKTRVCGSGHTTNSYCYRRGPPPNKHTIHYVFLHKTNYPISADMHQRDSRICCCLVGSLVYFFSLRCAGACSKGVTCMPPDDVAYGTISI